MILKYPEEASINDIGDVELEDLTMSEIIDKTKEAVADGSFGDNRYL